MDVALCKVQPSLVIVRRHEHPSTIDVKRKKEVSLLVLPRHPSVLSFRVNPQRLRQFWRWSSSRTDCRSPTRMAVRVTYVRCTCIALHQNPLMPIGPWKQGWRVKPRPDNGVGLVTSVHAFSPCLPIERVVADFDRAHRAALAQRSRVGGSRGGCDSWRSQPACVSRTDRLAVGGSKPTTRTTGRRPSRSSRPS